MSKYFSKENIQMANKNPHERSTSFASQEKYKSNYNKIPF